MNRGRFDAAAALATRVEYLELARHKDFPDRFTNALSF
jgi:uncharacterized 2Fe-2S/4Fe-4S cluster protein (DUF4445 family)